MHFHLLTIILNQPFLAQDRATLLFACDHLCQNLEFVIAFLLATFAIFNIARLYGP